MYQYKIHLLAVLFTLCGYNGIGQTKTKETVVEIQTTYGNVRIKLYNETPKHRDNFIKLIQNHFYDSLLFHRVLQNFMIQGGDPTSKHSVHGTMLGMGENGYTIPSEFNRKAIHKRGALAAARLSESVNPKKESSGCQFYIVQGTAVDTKTLDIYETNRITKRQNELIVQYLQNPETVSIQQTLEKARQQNSQTALDSAIAIIKTNLKPEFDKLDSLKYTAEQRKAYITSGGTPHLDFEYTVFGEVTEGMDVVDKIASQAVDRNGRPESDIIMKVKIIK